MRLAVMQPYFLPYLGYFQLIAACDTFVVYDNIEYTKKGWINRNRLLRDGEAVTFSLPLKGASDTLAVCDRELAADFGPEKLLNQFRGAYSKAPFFQSTFALLERIVRHSDWNLFRYLQNSLDLLCEYLEIKTKRLVSSAVPIDHSLRKQEKVIAFCQCLGASAYVNPIGGVELYSQADFEAEGITLKFLRMKATEYAQYDAAFVPGLSIIDVLMFNPIETVRDSLVNGYELI
jgi:hypothetical protein